MAQPKKLISKAGVQLWATHRQTDKHAVWELRIKAKESVVLHWGLAPAGGRWQLPPPECWPKGSEPFDDQALRTHLLDEPGEGCLSLEFDLEGLAPQAHMAFVLYLPESGRWLHNGKTDVYLPLQPTSRGPDPLEVLRPEAGEYPIVHQRALDFGELGQLALSVVDRPSDLCITWLTTIDEPLWLHWGITQASRQWQAPPASLLPEGTRPHGGTAVQTPFVRADDALARVQIEVPKQDLPKGLLFVLLLDGSERWLNHRGRDVFVPLAQRPAGAGLDLGSRALSEVAQEIVDSELGRSSWTLMHRFNLCHDLLEDVGQDRQGLLLLFVWLRFSAIRQLDWQRRYNTQPRELSHAQDRLTTKLAQIYLEDPDNRDVVRLMMSTLGRGGDGQRIRDQILEIMHRHHIKEVANHFMEEWHQKLHNNATPDDIAICEAYLAFLRSDGRQEAFYETLAAAGVTKERLESYDRPIRTAPNFVPHLKDPLIGDFGDYLRTLKSVHQGTDLDAAIGAASSWLDHPTRDLLRQIVHHPAHDAVARVRLIGQARQQIHQGFDQPAASRDLLFLDLSLDDAIRVTVERNIHHQFATEPLCQLTAHALENLLLNGLEEIDPCLRHWRRLMAEGNRLPPVQWASRAYAVVQRLRRVVSSSVDRCYQQLQPLAESLGTALRIEPWAIELFSEEVVRGAPTFALSLLLRQLDRSLREIAGISDWQVVSPGRASGHLEVVESLASIQGESFDRPTVILAERVTGEEDVPAGVTGVVTPDTPDLVAHVAVRARNAGLLLAACRHNPTLDRLRSLQGHPVLLTITPAGDVQFAEHEVELSSAPPAPQGASRTRGPRRTRGLRPITIGSFSEDVVGGKSHNLARLQTALPQWAGVPESVAIPFGVDQATVDHADNRDMAAAIKAAQDTLQQPQGAQERRQTLEILRDLVGSLRAPPGLLEALADTLQQAGLPYEPEQQQRAWDCIRQVWASKWNERAFLGRRRHGIAHESLLMAVLIQRVVPAEYAFVLHTVNPLSPGSDELFAEVVVGLGETLVGNHPGRALGFLCAKTGESVGEPRIISYPSKSTAMYGHGLIFRSDSSGEDLAGYAGAGLYDSVLLKPPRESLIDYSTDRLLWDTPFRDTVLQRIGQIGLCLERALGTPQDIEGAYSHGRYYVVQARPQVGRVA